MAKKPAQRLSPHKLPSTRIDQAWCYETRAGLEVYMGLPQTDALNTTLSWRLIEGALGRYKATKRRREKN